MKLFSDHRITFLILCPGILTVVVIALVAGFWLHSWSRSVEADMGIHEDDQSVVGEITEDHGLEEYVEATSTPLFVTSTLLIAPPVKHLRAITREATSTTSTDVGIRVPVLMYHHIEPLRSNMTPRQKVFVVTPEAFAQQMQELHEAGYTTVTPDDLADAWKNRGAGFPKKPVMITFDDGFRDQYHYAVPVLKRFGMTGVFFVVTGATRLRGSMTDEMFQELDRTGVGYIGSHTENHAFLTKYSAAARWKEIHGSKTYLEKLLGHPVTAFAYPYGSWNPIIVEELKRAGYEMAFGVRIGSLQYASHAFDLRRIRVLDKERVLDLVRAFGAQ